MWKIWIYAIHARCLRAQRARGHVRTGNFETLKMTWLVLKIVKKWFWAFSNFETRARARRDAHRNVDCKYVRQLPEVYVYWIWLIYDEWLWRYEWWSEITKWRLDDVMVGWSDWKGYSIHSSSGQRYCENLNMIVASFFEISSKQNSYRKK